MRGFWVLADVAAFAAALRKAIEPLGPPPHRYSGLCDSRDFPVQSMDVSQAIAALGVIAATIQEGPTAVVVGSVMNKLQAQRALTASNVRVFLTMEEAEAWLAPPQSTEQ